MTPTEYMSQTYCRLQRVRQNAKKESEVYERFVMAARQHTLALRSGKTILYIENALVGDDPITRLLIERTCNVDPVHLKMVSAKDIAIVKQVIQDCIDDLKAVVLEAGGGNGEQEVFDWINKTYNGSLPVLAVVDSQETAQQLRQQYPSVEPILKPRE
jgi:hypothetical protein